MNAQIAVTAGLLRSCARIDWLTTGFTLVAAASLIFHPLGLAAIIAIVLGLIAKYYAVRISFDAGLFNAAADGSLPADDLDSALHELALAAPPADRSWSDRCRGAIAMIRTFVLVAVAQTAAIIFIAVSFTGGR